MRPGGWTPLVALCLGTFILQLDVTIVTVALPQLAHGLTASFDDLQWVLDGYAVALAAALLGLGALADRVGLRKINIIGIAVFAVASLGCTLAPSAEFLIGARVVQGVGAAMIFATSVGLLSATYDGRRRGIAFGVWGAVAGAASAAGPVVGGLLTEYLDWRWIFAVNLPVCLITAWLTRTSVPEPPTHDRRVDLPGAVTFAVAISALVYALVRGGVDGWQAPQILIAFSVTAVAGVAFVIIELRRPDPLLDLTLFRRPTVVGLLAGGLLLQGAAFGAMPYTSIWLQNVLGLGPVATGLVILPQAGLAFLAAGIGGRLLHGVPHRWPIGIGLALIGAGLLILTGLSPESGWAALVPGFAVSGLGVGLALPAQANAMMSAVPPRSAGMAGGALNTFRQLGFALGVAVFGILSTARLESATGGERAAWADALSTVYSVAGPIALLAAVLSIALIRPTTSQPKPEPVTADTSS